MTLSEIRKTVWKHKPVLKILIQNKGHLSISKYYRENHPVPKNKTRQQELISVIKEKVTSLINKEVSKTVEKELRKNFFASTADHHQPLCHPFFLNSNLVQSYANSEKGLKNILILACSDISLNNSSYPRGIFFHDKELNEVRLPFFSLKYRHRPIFGLQSYQKERLETIPETLKPIFLNKRVTNSKTYSDQITIINFELWRRIPGEHETNLIYLNQEEIVSSLIRKYHLKEPTVINQIIFNPTFRRLFLKHFKNIIGAFNTKHQKGTFLFWGLKDGKRISLTLEGEKLTSKDGFNLLLEPRSTRTSITKGEIIPSMALSFITLSFYYGLPCGGGFSQVNYLEEMKVAYLKMLNETGKFKKEIDQTKKIPTNIFRGEFVLASLSNRKKQVPATTIDLILHAHKDTPKKIRVASKQVHLKAAVDQMMPEFYKIITGKKAKFDVKSSIPPSLYV